MDLNEYVVTSIAASRLAEARQIAAHQAVLDGVRGPRGALRAALGGALVAAGRWLLGPGAPAPHPPR